MLSPDFVHISTTAPGHDGQGKSGLQLLQARKGDLREVCSFVCVCVWVYEFLGLDKLQELLVTWVCATRKRNIPASSSGQRKPEVLFALVGMELSASYLLGHGFSTELHPLELESCILRLLTTSLHTKYQCLWWPGMRGKLYFFSTPVVFITSQECYSFDRALLLAEGCLWM